MPDEQPPTINIIDVGPSDQLLTPELASGPSFEPNFDLLEAVLTSGVAGFAIVDKDFRFVRLNSVLAGLSEADRAQFVGGPVEDLVGANNWAMVQPCLERAFRGEPMVDVHVCQDRPDGTGTLRRHDTSFLPLKVNGEIQLVATTVHDVTEKENAAQAVRDSEARYRLLADTVPHLVWMVAANGHFEYVNHRWQEFTGLGLDQMRRRGWESVVVDGDYGVLDSAWVSAREAGLPLEAECRLRRKDGMVRWFLLRAVPFGDVKSGDNGWLGTCTDVEDQKRAERTQRFLSELSRRMRAATTPEDIMSEVVASLGVYLNASRCGFSEFERPANEDAIVTIRSEYRAPGVVGVEGSYPMSSFSPFAEQSLAAGVTIAIEDVDLDPRTSNHAAFYRDVLRVRSSILAPITRKGIAVATLAVTQADRPRRWTDDEIALVQTVAERAWLGLDSARLYRERQQAEGKQRAFVRDILAGVTQGRLVLCDDASELPEALPAGAPGIRLIGPEFIGWVRHLARSVAAETGFEEARCMDLLTAVSEAAMNAVVHAVNGHVRVCCDGAECVQVWIEDQGSGIAVENIPHATLVRGYSTRSTLGHGFKMILSTIDRVYLLTNEGGTTVVLEQNKTAADFVW